MKISEWCRVLEEGSSADFCHLYADAAAAKERFLAAFTAFEKQYGKNRDVFLFSVPGRSEICGNHTDHNRGCVLAGAIDRDVIAVVSPNREGILRVQSEGYREIIVPLEKCREPEAFPSFTSAALVAGVAGGFAERGYAVGGFDAYTTTQVLKGSGLSSSAAFEVMVGTILNHLYNKGAIEAPEIAAIAQYAENTYFGKPSGLMDQMACAVGGVVFIDFEKESAPLLRRVAFSLEKAGYVMAIVNTGGSHSDLNDDYAAVPAEMRAVASYFGQDTLRAVSEEALLANAPILRRAAGDRALLRALHFVRENARVVAGEAALREGRFEDFLAIETASGRSSFEYLQNVYTDKHVQEQGISLALCVTEGALAGKGAAFRVHGGGFAGTIQVFLKKEMAEDYRMLMDSVFGEGACMLLNIRKTGATAIRA